MVSRGPAAPVCTVGYPCSQPASGAHLLFERHRHVVARVTVAKDGSYSVRLRPGVYRVAVQPEPKVGRGIEPRHVRVTRGPASEADFQIDTGIR